EVREQEREQEYVVEGEGALDQVNGRPLAGRAVCQRDDGRDRDGEHEPAGTPDDRLAPTRRTARREQAQLGAESGDDRDSRGGSEGDFHRASLPLADHAVATAARAPATRTAAERVPMS